MKNDGMVLGTLAVTFALAALGAGCGSKSTATGATSTTETTTSATSASTTTSATSASTTTGGQGGNGAGGQGTGGSAASPCATGDAEVQVLRTCAAMATDTVDVPSGCVPTVDGKLHANEWTDGACFTGADMTLVVKYGGDAVYLATSGMPTCGCPMNFFFDPDGGTTFDGDEFGVSVFDDPSAVNGDRSELTYKGGAWSMGTAPAGIVTACPGQAPTPIRYEWKIPFSALKLQAGTAHTFRLGIVHAMTAWPAGLHTNGMRLADDLTTFGKLGSMHWN